MSTTISSSNPIGILDRLALPPPTNEKNAGRCRTPRREEARRPSAPSTTTPSQTTFIAKIAKRYTAPPEALREGGQADIFEGGHPGGGVAHEQRHQHHRPERRPSPHVQRARQRWGSRRRRLPRRWRSRACCATAPSRPARRPSRTTPHSTRRRRYQSR